VLEECPVAPGRSARLGPQATATASPGPRRGRGRRRGDTKSARFLALVTEHHGPLPAIPLNNVAKISAAFAPQIDLNTDAARTVLRRAVLAAHAPNGDPSSTPSPLAVLLAVAAFMSWAFLPARYLPNNRLPARDRARKSAGGRP
jgi:hypothetical protein